MDQKQEKVLVVEDDATMREIVVHKLSSEGLQVIEAVDGREAIVLWQREKPDIVLLDLMLPEVDGFKVLETIRKDQDPEIANTPVLVLSNLYNEKDIQRIKELTVEDFLVKAYYTTEEIYDKVREILNQKETP